MQPAPDPKLLANDLHLVFPADPVSVRTGLARLLSLPPLADLPAEDRGTAELVLAEVLNNVAEHAYAQSTGAVEVSLSPWTDGLACLVLDHGVEMPGGMLPQGGLPGGPDTALEDLPEGGFGWHLIRTLTRELTYARAGGCNRLSFILPTGRQDL
ncbi:ATP-binding protein [Tabrizicola sp.]|uniref:ATP-binding protein n=1 Tax=Tabrizicola sp. TaxID=2005166 RepID=UPI003F2DB6EB